MKSRGPHGEVKSHCLSDSAGGTNPENSGKPTETEKLRETPFTLSEAIAGVDVVYCDSWMSRMLRAKQWHVIWVPQQICMSLFHLISTRRCGCKSHSATTSCRLWHSKGWGRGEKEAFHALPGRAGSLANLAIENMWQILTTHVPCKTWLRSPQSWWSWRNLMRYSWTARDSEGKGQPRRFCDTKRISVCKIALPNQSPPPVCFPCILCLRFIFFPARKYPGACLQCTCTLFIVLFVSLCFLFSSRSLPFRILSER